MLTTLITVVHQTHPPINRMRYFKSTKLIILIVNLLLSKYLKKIICSKHNILQRSMELSNNVSSLSQDRNIILKEYYDKKLQILERIAIAKEEKVILMKAASFKERNLM